MSDYLSYAHTVGLELQAHTITVIVNCGQLSPTNKVFMSQITYSMLIEEMESVPSFPKKKLRMFLSAEVGNVTLHQNVFFPRHAQ